MGRLDSYYDKRIVTIREESEIKVFVDGQLFTLLKSELTNSELKQEVDKIWSDINSSAN